MSRSWKVEGCQKKKNSFNGRDYQSAITSKEHVKYWYEATQTYLSVIYQHDRMHLTGKRPQQRSQGPQQQQSTPSTHRLYFSKESSSEKKKKMRYRGECMPPLVSSVDTVYLLRVAQLNNRRNLYNTTFEAPGTQRLAMLLCGFSGAVIVTITTSSSFSHACACHVYIHVCTYVYLSKFNKQMTNALL